MLKKIKFFTIVVLILFVATERVFSDNIKGYMIPEYYVIAGHNDNIDTDKSFEGQHGFWLRRIYLGYNTKISEKFSARIRFEMNSTAFKKGRLIPYLKNAHLRYDLNNLSLLIGIIEPPSFDKIEKFWGHRFIEKTAPDFFKLASSRDFGMAINGKTGSGIVYTVMYGNYSSNKGENNKGKAFYTRIGYKTKLFYAEANAHYASDEGKKVLYMASFLGLKNNRGRIGIGYYNRNEDYTDKENIRTDLISVHTTLKFSKNYELFFRYDHFLKKGLKDIGGYVPTLCKNALPRFIITGFVFKIHKRISLSPNIKYAFYKAISDSNNVTGKDLYFNITAKISFKTNMK